MFDVLAMFVNIAGLLNPHVINIGNRGQRVFNGRYISWYICLYIKHGYLWRPDVGGRMSRRWGRAAGTDISQHAGLLFPTAWRLPPLRVHTSQVLLGLLSLRTDIART